MQKKYVYLFSEGNATMRELLGGKGANLAEMTNIGLPVPQGFTVTTEACTQYYEDGRKINDDIQAQIMEYIDKMESITGKKFGDKNNPLLVSVRSGARASMPGMMDTILNLGLNEEVVEVMSQMSGTLLPAFVHPCLSLKWLTNSRKLSNSSKKFALLWKTTTEICRIWSSPLSTANSSCSRPETVRELQKLLSRSPATW